MKVDKYKVLGDLIETNKRQFVIPVYQRNYDWKKTHCKKLFDDILNAFRLDRFHFVGSIVYVDQGEENKIYRYLIIDGQQRITTLFLLLKALLDCSSDDNTKKEIEDLLFNVDKYSDLKLTDQTKVKLKPIKSDNDQFILLMKNDFKSIDVNSNIYINYDYMKKLIQKEIEKGNSIKEILSGLKKLTAAVIILDAKEDDPQVVFESINSTGLSLSLADLIRNFILMTDKNQDILFENYWIKIENNVTQQRMTAFITDYLQFACREMISSQNAYEKFKSFFRTSGYSNEEMLRELLRYSEYYKVFYGGKDDSYSEVVRNKLDGFRALDQGTIYPFLFHVFDDFNNQIITNNELEKVLTFFLNYLLRRVVCGVGSNTLKGLYKTLYNRLFADKEKLNSYYDTILLFFAQLSTKDAIPSDSIFKDALINADLYNKKNVCKYLLKSIEEFTFDGSLNKEKLDVTAFSIEHIMPQKLTEYWISQLGNQYEKVHEKYLHNLGNLTLTGYNSELGNKTFEEKKKYILEKNSHVVVLNQDVLNQNIWNEETIKARSERLSSIIQKMFFIEKPTSIAKNFENIERKLYIGDDFDATGTKPKMCILCGESLAVTSYAEMLSKVMETLYEIDDNIMDDLAMNNYILPNATKIYITKNRSLLRKPYEIYESGIFFESNLSANNIISFIRAVLDGYGLDYTDFLICLDDKK